MRILYIIPNLRKGGAERLLVNIVSELSKKNGIDVRLVLLENKIDYDVEGIQQFIYIIPSKIKLSLVKKNEYFISELQQFIDSFQPDIIHTHLFEAEIISRTCYYMKAKWFSHCHDNMKQFRNIDFQNLFNKKYLLDYYEKKYLFKNYKKNGGTHFIAISKDTKKYFEKVAPPYTVDMLPNGINYDLFLNENGYIKEKLKLINIGALNENKNQKFLIDVSKTLDNYGVDFQMFILGDGEERLFLEKKVELNNLQNKVFLKGMVSNVEEYLKDASIYLHSAKSEALGLTLIEAMAAGLPVITLDGKGNRDLILEGENGYMLFESDVKKFADIIINLWNDKNKYQKMSTYAQQFARQFDIGDYCIALLNLYKKY